VHRGCVKNVPTMTNMPADVQLWTAPRPPQTCYVVHGEPKASNALAHRIHTELGWCATVPRHAERVLI